MAIGYFNNDGALDVHIAINDGAPLLLKNQTGHLNHWLGARLVAKRANPDAVGALVSWQAGDLKRSLFKAGGDRKSTRLNSRHQIISYAVFCLKKKTQI